MTYYKYVQRQNLIAKSRHHIAKTNYSKFGLISL